MENSMTNSGICNFNLDGTINHRNFCVSGDWSRVISIRDNYPNAIGIRLSPWWSRSTGNVAVVLNGCYVLTDGVFEFVFWYSMEEATQSSLSPWEWVWMACVSPNNFIDYALISPSCVCTLGGHLATYTLTCIINICSIVPTMTIVGQSPQ